MFAAVLSLYYVCVYSCVFMCVMGVRMCPCVFVCLSADSRFKPGMCLNFEKLLSDDIAEDLMRVADLTLFFKEMRDVCNIPEEKTVCSRVIGGYCLRHVDED